MSSFKERILENGSPKVFTKRKIRKHVLKRMSGKTKKERFSNFFTNKQGYYSWKEMILNYSIIIFIVGVVATSIGLGVTWKTLNISTLMINPIFDIWAFSIGGLFACLWSKRKQRKRRFDCYINNGISDKYVFWKDDKSNPNNRVDHHSFG